MSKSLATIAHRNPMPVGENRRIITNPDGTITLSIPISFKRHGGRKYIVAPTEVMNEPTPPKESLLKALGRAFHWQTELVNDPTLTQESISLREGFGRSYVSKIMFLTLLAPDVIEAILDGRYPKYLTLTDIMKAGVLWDDQRKLFGLV